MEPMVVSRGLVILGKDQPPDLLYVSYPDPNRSVEPNVHEPDHHIALYARLDALQPELRSLVLQALDRDPSL